MRTSKSRVVKAFLPGGDHVYYSSLGACCREHHIRYEDRLIELVERGGLAPDGKTFFDWPTETEMKMLEDGEIIFRDKLPRSRKKEDYV